jgi:RNA polymerase sigma-70 factor (ECF subfamily)
MSALDLEQVYLQYSGKVTGYLQARLHNRAVAEDLCAEVFEKALRKQEGYDPKKSAVGTWIFTIAVCVFLAKKVFMDFDLDEEEVDDAR